MTAPFHVPLTLESFSTSIQLGINVGINDGQLLCYLFDTGSTVFNAAFDPNAWGSSFAGSKSVPDSPFTGGSGLVYHYGPKSAPIGNITGNLLQVGSLTFPTATGTLKIKASPGYVVNALSAWDFSASGGSTYSFPSYFNTSSAPFFNNKYFGIFGAGNFAATPWATLAPGGILGQIYVTGVTQGYVVAANGQVNPASSTNAPQNTNGINVMIGSKRTPITSCNPCLTVGLTTAIIGQFAPVGPPGETGNAGVMPVTPGGSFTNANSGNVSGPGNNGATEFGATFLTSLTPSGASAPAKTKAVSTLLDTGAVLKVASDFNVSAVSADGTTVSAGAMLALTGATSGGTAVTSTAVPGLVPSSATLTNGATLDTYNASFYPTDNTRSGIWFFLQNSVMYDLTDNVIGYTPFFVTEAPVDTSNGTLTVDGTNVPLGLAGVISGTGGVQVDSGGQLQLSNNTNSYTGPTTINANGLLLVSGPGGSTAMNSDGAIGNSSGVLNNGVLDISRAWSASPVRIAALSGSGQVYLGSQALTITKANGTFSGTLSDGGSAAAFPGTGGSLAIAGGTQTLTDENVIGDLRLEQGAELVNAGNLQLVGSISSVNHGTLINNGMLTGQLSNAYSGQISGSGAIVGDVDDGGLIAPGFASNTPTTLSIIGSYTQTASGRYMAVVNAQGQSDQIAVSGSAELQGGTVQVIPLPGGTYSPGTKYTILTTTGPLMGTYSPSVLFVGSQSMKATLSYDDSSVYLTMA